MYHAVVAGIEKEAGVVGSAINKWHADNPTKSRLSSLIGGSQQRHRDQAAGALRSARSAAYLGRSAGRVTQGVMRKGMAEGDTPASAINAGNMAAVAGRAAGRGVGRVAQGLRAGMQSFGQAMLQKNAGTLGNQINQFAGPKSVGPIRSHMAGMLRGVRSTKPLSEFDVAPSKPQAMARNHSQAMRSEMIRGFSYANQNAHKQISNGGLPITAGMSFNPHQHGYPATSMVMGGGKGSNWSGYRSPRYQ